MYGLLMKKAIGISAINVPVAYIYNALRSSTIGMTSAAAFFQSVACCITIILANAIVKKFDEDSAII